MEEILFFGGKVIVTVKCSEVIYCIRGEFALDWSDAGQINVRKIVDMW